MFARIPELLNSGQISEFRHAVDAMQWEDGRLSGAAASKRKFNEQLTHLNQATHPLLNKALKAVVEDPRVIEWATPRRIARILFSRYREGMTYGSHNDAAVTNFYTSPSRADISFTVFLSDPSEYGGGELVLETPVGEVSIKDPAGTIVLYDTGLRHRVETITSGTRLVIVGWIESLVKRPDCRHVLRELSAAIADSAKRDPDGAEVIRLRGIFADLQRIWAET